MTTTQLETLLNGLLRNEEKLPYSFFIQEVELAVELGAHLLKNKVSVETALQIVYQPQAVFRVRPVSRCTASMPGALRNEEGTLKPYCSVKALLLDILTRPRIPGREYTRPYTRMYQNIPGQVACLVRRARRRASTILENP